MSLPKHLFSFDTSGAFFRTTYMPFGRYRDIDTTLYIFSRQICLSWLYSIIAINSRVSQPFYLKKTYIPCIYVTLKKKCSYADVFSLKNPLEKDVYAMYIRYFEKKV